MNKRLKSWLDKYAVIVDKESGFEEEPIMKAYVTKDNGDYIGLVNLVDSYDKEISHLISLINVHSSYGKGYPVSIGFNPKEQKWYGFTHRGMCGFGIGSEVKKGDCAYQPTDKDDFLDDCFRFWEDDHHENLKAEHSSSVNELGEEEFGVYVSWTYSDKVENKYLVGQITGVFSIYPTKWGNGEWTAKTLDDAKQMAYDFVEGTS